MSDAIASRALNQFLKRKLEPISKADPTLLANYVAALLEHDKPLDELKQFCLEQLQAFLENSTEEFVDTVFNAIELGVIEIPGVPYENNNNHSPDLNANQGKINETEVQDPEGLNANSQDLERVNRNEGGDPEGLNGIEGEGNLYGNDAEENIDLPNEDDLLLGSNFENEFIEIGDADVLQEYENERDDGDLEEEESLHTPNEESEHNNLSLQYEVDQREGGESSDEDDNDDDRNHKHRRRISEKKTLEEVMEESKTARGGNPENFSDPLSRKRNYSDDGNNFRGKNWNNKNDVRRKDFFRSKDFPSRPNKREPWENFPHGLSGVNNLNMPGRFPFDPLSQNPFRGMPFPADAMMNGTNNFNLLPQGNGMADVWNAGYGGRFPFPEASEINRMMSLQGSVPNLLPGLFPGMIPNRPGVGLVPGSANPMIPLGMNMAGMNISRARCSDFEQKGFCLRGDLCPMDHGANRIVVDDMKGFQQFNLPPSSHSNPSQKSNLVKAESKHNFNPSIPLNSVRNAEVLSSELPMKAEPYAAMAGNAKAAAAFQAKANEVEPYDPANPYINPLAFQSSLAGQSLRSKSLKKKTADGDEKSMNEKTQNTVAASGSSVWNRIRVSENATTVADTEKSKVQISVAEGPVKVKKDSESQLKVREAFTTKNVLNRNERSKEAVSFTESSQKWNGNGKNVPISSKPFPQTQPNPMKWNLSNIESPAFESQPPISTLFVKGLPFNLPNLEEKLMEHFCQFGEVISVKIVSSQDKAYVQFSKRSDAVLALNSPEPVLGNRFIRLSWASRDSHVESNPVTKAAGFEIGSEKFAFEFPHRWTAESNAANLSTAAAAASATTTATTASAAVFQLDTGTVKNENGSLGGASAESAALKQKEKFDMLREIQKKKESILKMQIEQQKMILDKLKKTQLSQPSTPTKTKTPTPPMKDAPDPSINQKKVASSPSPVDATSAKSDNVSGSPVQSVQNHDMDVPRGIHAKHPYPQTRPLRFKIDNRSTSLKIIPPFPPTAADQEAIFNHFSMFGEVSEMEYDYEGDESSAASMEASQNQKNNEKKDAKSESELAGVNENEQNEYFNEDKEILSIRITYVVRSAAERAFSMASWFNGKKLNIVWNVATKSILKNVDSSIQNSTVLNNSQQKDAKRMSVEGMALPPKRVKREEKEIDNEIKNEQKRQE